MLLIPYYFASANGLLLSLSLFNNLSNIGVRNEENMINPRVNGMIVGSTSPESTPSWAVTMTTSALAIIPIPIDNDSLNLNLDIKAPVPAPNTFPNRPNITQIIPNIIKVVDIDEDELLLPTPRDVYIFKATEAKKTGVNITLAVVSAR